jgi:hypothetical protein
MLLPLSPFRPVKLGLSLGVHANYSILFEQFAVGVDEPPQAPEVVVGVLCGEDRSDARGDVGADRLDSLDRLAEISVEA